MNTAQEMHHPISITLSPAVQKENDERAAFEEWAIANQMTSAAGVDRLDYPLGRCLWRAWKARAIIADRYPQPLTDEQIQTLAWPAFYRDDARFLPFARAIEAAHGIA